MELVSSSIGLVVLCIVILALGVAGYAVMFVFGNLGAWLELRTANVPVTFWQMFLIKIRKLDRDLLLSSMKTLWKAGQSIELEALESHVMAGGSLPSVVQAAIAASKAGLQVDFAQMAAMDLAGRDVLEAVKANVEPKVLVCPPPSEYGNGGIVGMTGDGIALEVKVRVTVRTRLERLVGGAGESTVLARVGEGIITALGGTASHKEILQHPEIIMKSILGKGLDSGTCYEILSVDVADIDVLDNVSARLETQRAETDKRIAQARAASARANAIAQQQEMKAVNLENAAKVVAAKAALPLALRHALDSENMGVPSPVPAPIPPQICFWRKGLKAFQR